MKKIVFCLILFGTILIQKADAQHKITIYSYVSATGFTAYVNFGNLKIFLPDSLKSKIIINYRKGFKRNEPEALIYRMGLDGWHIAFMSSNGFGSGSTLSISPFFVLTKDIELSDEAFTYYNKLMTEKDH